MRYMKEKYLIKILKNWKKKWHKTTKKIKSYHKKVKKGYQTHNYSLYYQ